LARIPADAYDIPLIVLALSSPVLGSLKQAKIENLGQIMERLADGDESLLALEGIDSKGLSEIKDQVEIMVSVPLDEPDTASTPEEEQRADEARFPRFEYVPDDDIEKRTQPRRQRRRKPRRYIYDDESDEVVSQRSDRADDWDNFDE
jgi:hypothetical protein